MATTVVISYQLPLRKPADYEQEFVDPSHLEAVATNADLQSVSGLEGL